MLVAATGVGAGDLATAAFTGNKLGLAILWAVAVGATLKFVLNEGLARWQLATGRTLLEGGVRHLGKPFQYFMLLFLVFWSWFVGSALMSACGVAGYALLPLFESPLHGKILFGVGHSALGLALAYAGGYRLFEKVMSACVGIMFLTVVTTAVLLAPSWGELLSGLLIPRIPDLQGDGLPWSVALMGGVGGTLTVLCYGYWIREEGRTGPQQLWTCRIDLACGYFMTALFGLAMVVIGSSIEIEGSGAGLIVKLAEKLEQELGAAGRWAFLIGSWGAVFSSLLGVWQSVPYLFADLWRLTRRPDADPGEKIDTRSRPYLGYMLALGTIPAIGLWGGFQQVQKLYAIVGAAFMPVLALTLLLLNGSSKRVGALRNRPSSNLILIAILLFFLWAGTY